MMQLSRFHFRDCDLEMNSINVEMQMLVGSTGVGSLRTYRGVRQPGSDV